MLVFKRGQGSWFFLLHLLCPVTICLIIRQLQVSTGQILLLFVEMTNTAAERKTSSGVKVIKLLSFCQISEISAASPPPLQCLCPDTKFLLFNDDLSCLAAVGAFRLLNLVSV